MTSSTDIDAIRELLQAMLTEGRSAEALDLIVGVLKQLKTDNDRLQQRLGRLLRDRFGRTSEKISTDQLRLFLDEINEPVAPGLSDTRPDSTPAASPGRVSGSTGKNKRRQLPPELPREEITLEPSAEQRVCGDCGTPKHCIGQERTETLELVPARFKVLVHIRPKYACRQCEGRVVIAQIPSKPIEAGRPGFGLLTDVLVKKYAEHCPLHRMRDIYRRAGVDLPVSNLVGWVAAGAGLLEPIDQAIERMTLASHVVQADDTGLCVLDTTVPKGSKRGHMWAYVADRRWVTFRYTPTWSGQGPCGFLSGREGWVQADAYSGYDRLFASAGARCVEVGCWAHCRRYFHKALPTDRRAAVAIHFIGQLYDIERQARTEGLDTAAHLALRTDKSRSVLDEFWRWVERTAPAAPPKSPLGGAITYAVNQRKALERFTQDARLELDNNGCERALRIVAVGRKNWMFAGSDEGAHRAAIIYTVFGTCRLNGVDPWTYTRDVLEKIEAGWPHSRIDELLPPAWAASKAREAPDTDRIAVPA